MFIRSYKFFFRFLFPNFSKPSPKPLDVVDHPWSLRSWAGVKHCKEGHWTSGASPTNGFVNKVNLLHHSLPLYHDLSLCFNRGTILANMQYVCIRIVQLFRSQQADKKDIVLWWWEGQLLFVRISVAFVLILQARAVNFGKHKITRLLITG